MTKLERFIENSNKKHNSKYDYSKVEYKNSLTRVCIICPEHGEFWQTPQAHSRGNGCPKCSNARRGRIKRMSVEEFIGKSINKHGNFYNYSKVKYINSSTKVEILCPMHGTFYQTPGNHLNGQGCPKCAGKGLNTEEVIKRFVEVHGELYDYSKVDFMGMHKYVTIICPEHGEFKQTPAKHIQGQKCKKCSFKKRRTEYNKSENDLFSIGEMDIYQMLIGCLGEENVILRSNNVNIYVPNKNIGICYRKLIGNNNGKWEFYDKTIDFENNGGRLIQIFEDEYNEKKLLIFNKIKHILKIERVCPKIMGRKCKIRIIDNYLAKDFLDSNHLDGYSNTTISLGAYYQNILIGVMCFTKTGDNGYWVLNRFATDIKYVCQGVGGKLFNFFIKEYKPVHVKSFADKRWVIDKDNNLYTKIGFKLTEELNPEYRYIDKNKPKERIHKFNLRKKTLHNSYNLPIDMGEKNVAKELNLIKIWDCGLLKYEWNKT